MPAILFDLSRSFSRSSHGTPTGIDRVEHALFNALSAISPVQGLVRSGQRYWAGPGEQVMAALGGVGRIDSIGRLQPWRDSGRRSAEGALRAALGRGARALPVPREGQWLICVGHSLPPPAELQRWRMQGGELGVLVHDLIPIEHPEWSRTAPAQRFAAAMQVVAQHASLVLHLTGVGRDRWEARYGHPIQQRHAVLPMGATDLPLLSHTPHTRPSMLVVGTIEPRKGHEILLDLWDQFAPVADLRIIGKRGWNNDRVFSLLDRNPLGVIEIRNASDADLAREYSAAHTLLFPSQAEGYGLPVMEARVRNLHVIASDLPQLRELHGNTIQYVCPDSPAAWALAIEQRLRENISNTNNHSVFWASWDQSARVLLSLLAVS